MYQVVIRHHYCPARRQFVTHRTGVWFLFMLDPPLQISYLIGLIYRLIRDMCGAEGIRVHAAGAIPSQEQSG